MASDRARRNLAALERQGQTERVIYRPGKSGLLPREIVAVVDRIGVEDIMHGNVPGLRVTALNDEADGIPADPRLSDLGADRIDVAERVGGERIARSMARFAQQDADWLTVEVA